ncbi:MAG: TRAP transporter small permease [Phreatobacter sp.]|jgi:TRAP-type C4-dicarboxylate transport system permease small subunit|uniref:TRAP transporter small permease n=1 Tax=Phreatobacter sp. TaxID=1966341 RepID=UPI004036991F
MSPNPPPAGQPSDDVHLIVAEDEEVVVEKHVEDWMAIALFWVLAFIVFLQFFTRYVLNNSLSWTEEIARYLLMVLVFVGGAMVVRRNTNIAVELVQNVMRDGPLKRTLIGAVEVTKLVFIGLLAWFAVLITERMHNLYMTVFDWPMSLVYGGIAIGCFMMVVRQGQIVWRGARTGFRRPDPLSSDTKAGGTP